jgi:hypothetical protein
MDSRFDDLLHTIIVEKGQGIYGFFDTVLGFMYRRTDFYYEMAPGENMGFFPGQSEQIIYNFFRKYQNLHYKERVPKRSIDPKKIEEFMKQNKGKVQNNTNLMGVPIEKVQNGNQSNLSNIKVPLESEKEEQVQQIEIDIKDKDNKIESNITKTSSIKKENIKDKEKKESKIDEKFESISTYNGDKCENYSWSQGVMDVNIQVKLPEKTLFSKVIKNIFFINYYLKI